MSLAASSAQLPTSTSFIATTATTFDLEPTPEPYPWTTETNLFKSEYMLISSATFKSNLLAIILVSDRDEPPFLDWEPLNGILGQEIYVKYNRRVSLIGFPSPTAFTSATGRAVLTLSSTVGARTTSTGSSGGNNSSNGAGHPGPPHPAVIIVIVIALTVAVTICSCLMRKERIKRFRERRAALDAELAAIELNVRVRAYEAPPTYAAPANIPVYVATVPHNSVPASNSAAPITQQDTVSPAPMAIGQTMSTIA
ncbi:hypothetical protein HDU96_007666 [Phlyctochytrium bullatum]|nr:hypothetical protein HDU96_007666 [Phlyctochytrium bullatum]